MGNSLDFLLIIGDLCDVTLRPWPQVKVHVASPPKKPLLPRHSRSSYGSLVEPESLEQVVGIIRCREIWAGNLTWALSSGSASKV